MSDFKNNTAGQIMSEGLLTVCETWSIQTLIAFFNEKKLSGAPVLSKNKDKIVGVVSLSDVLNFDMNPHHSMGENPMSQYYYNSLEGISPDELGLSEGNQHLTHLVSEIMTPEVISADVDTPVTKIASLMCKRGIHRVFISKNDEICGVVTTLDILQLIGEVDSAV